MSSASLQKRNVDRGGGLSIKSDQLNTEKPPNRLRRDGELPLLLLCLLVRRPPRRCIRHPRRRGQEGASSCSRTRVPVASRQEGSHRPQDPPLTPVLRDRQARYHPSRCWPNRNFPPDRHPSTNPRALWRHPYRWHKRRDRSPESRQCRSSPQRPWSACLFLPLALRFSSDLIGTVPNLKWSFSLSHTRLLNGGWIREQTVTDLPPCVFPLIQL